MSKILGNSAFTPLLFDHASALSSGTSPQALSLPSSAEMGRITPSRRKVLVGMASIPTAMAVWGCSPMALAAPPVGELLWSFAKPVFVSLLVRFVNQAVGALLRSPYLLGEDDVTQQNNPTPGGTRFHNSYASVFKVNADKDLAIMKSKYGFYVGITGGYVRAHDSEEIPAIKDINGPEFQRCQHIYTKTGGRHLLFPCGPRTPPNMEEKVAFTEFCQEKNIARENYDLEYCRPLNDGQNLYRGFAIRSTKLGSAATDILIADA